MMEKEYSMRHYRRLSKASADTGFSGDSGFSESSNNSMGQPPLFTLKMSNSAENNQNDRRASERAEVLKKHEFTITEELRRGVSGRVFLVKNPEEDSFVVKEINYRDNMNFNLDAVKKEISILKNLHHAYIVGYVDSFEESGYFYIVSEYCAGGDLFKKMKAQRKARFEEEQILDWFVQICLALQYLHKNNILHRDIKPQNVFLTEDGYINLGDFGCSKMLQSADEYATSTVGTELYISPEIYKNIRHNSKSDIWSLGWLLHDLCMLDVWSNMIKRRCLHANSLAGTRPKISNMDSEDLKGLICEMLSRDPHKRPSADEILAKPFLTEAVKRNRRILDALQRRSLSSINPYRNLNLELERSIEELKSCDRNLQTLSDKIKELDDTIDELESVHKAATVGSLVGVSVGAAGVITSITGACLAPFTLGASLALTVGGVVGAAGGVASAASNITNIIRLKTMCKNIGKIINDILTTINSMVELMDTIYNITENNELEKTTILKVAGVATVAEIGQICAEAAKEIRVYVNAVIAVFESISAAKAVRGSALAAKAGEIVAALLAAHVYCIVKYSIELSEMNQPAGKRKEEEISSEMLKFFLQLKAVADQFKKIMEIIKDAKDTIDTKWC